MRNSLKILTPFESNCILKIKYLQLQLSQNVKNFLKTYGNMDILNVEMRNNFYAESDYFNLIDLVVSISHENFIFSRTLPDICMNDNAKDEDHYIISQKDNHTKKWEISSEKNHKIYMNKLPKNVMNSTDFHQKLIYHITEYINDTILYTMRNMKKITRPQLYAVFYKINIICEYIDINPRKSFKKSKTAYKETEIFYMLKIYKNGRIDNMNNIIEFLEITENFNFLLEITKFITPMQINYILTNFLLNNKSKNTQKIIHILYKIIEILKLKKAYKMAHKYEYNLYNYIQNVQSDINEEKQSQVEELLQNVKQLGWRDAILDNQEINEYILNLIEEMAKKTVIFYREKNKPRKQKIMKEKFHEKAIKTFKTFPNRIFLANVICICDKLLEKVDIFINHSQIEEIKNGKQNNYKIVKFKYEMNEFVGKIHSLLTRKEHEEITFFPSVHKKFNNTFSSKINFETKQKIFFKDKLEFTYNYTVVAFLFDTGIVIKNKKILDSITEKDSYNSYDQLNSSINKEIFVQINRCKDYCHLSNAKNNHQELQSIYPIPGTLRNLIVFENNHIIIHNVPSIEFCKVNPEVKVTQNDNSILVERNDENLNFEIIYGSPKIINQDENKTMIYGSNFKLVAEIANGYYEYITVGTKQ